MVIKPISTPNASSAPQRRHYREKRIRSPVDTRGRRDSGAQKRFDHMNQLLSVWGGKGRGTRSKKVRPMHVICVGTRTFDATISNVHVQTVEPRRTILSGLD